MRYGRRALVGLRADNVKAVSIERLSLSLSPHVEKPLNSKRWIKVSDLNQFRVFGFLYIFYEHYVYFTYPYHPLYVIVFNWNHFKMRLLNLRINFFIYCGLFVLILVVFVLFLLSLRFGQISPLAFFRWLTAPSDRNAESCNRIPSNSGPVAQRIEALSLYGSGRALSEDSGFNSYPSRPEVYLVKNVVDRQQLWKAVITGDTVTKLSWSGNTC